MDWDPRLRRPVNSRVNKSKREGDAVGVHTTVRVVFELDGFGSALGGGGALDGGGAMGGFGSGLFGF